MVEEGQEEDDDNTSERVVSSLLVVRECPVSRSRDADDDDATVDSSRVLDPMEVLLELVLLLLSSSSSSPNVSIEGREEVSVLSRTEVELPVVVDGTRLVPAPVPVVVVELTLKLPL